jgi:hypothetical protein
MIELHHILCNTFYNDIFSPVTLMECFKVASVTVDSKHIPMWTRYNRTIDSHLQGQLHVSRRTHLHQHCIDGAASQ